jgi:hypothetical protein
MPRYYKYGYQGPQYAGQWSHQIPTPQTQAPGLRYGLGDEEEETLLAAAQSAKIDPSKLSDKELDAAISFTKNIIPSALASRKPIAEELLKRLEDEKADRKRNRLLLIGGAAAFGFYLYSRKR